MSNRVTLTIIVKKIVQVIQATKVDELLPCTYPDAKKLGTEQKSLILHRQVLSV